MKTAEVDKELIIRVETPVRKYRPAEVDKELGDPPLQPLLLIYKLETSESTDTGRSVPHARDETGDSRPEIAGGKGKHTYAMTINGIGEGGRSSA